MLTVLTATSTAVERVFSQGRQILHFTRNSLSAKSLRAFLCLGSWCRHDMVSVNDLVVAIKAQKGKVKHAEGTAVAAAPTADAEMLAD